MPAIAHRAFVVQANGIVYVCDGADEAYFASVADFIAAVPTFEMPAGAVALNYEVRGERVLHVHIAPGGAVSRQPGEAVASYDAIIDAVAALAGT